MENYETHCVNIGNKTGRGIVIYTERNITAEIYEPETKFDESLFLEIPVNPREKILFGCIYRSNSGSINNNRALNNLIREVFDKKYKQVVIVGDFNYPRIDWENWVVLPAQETHSEEHYFLEALRDNYAPQLIMKPTRGRKGQVPNILDLLVTEKEEKISNVEVRSPIGKSDHSVMAFTVNCKISASCARQVRYNYNKGNYDKIKDNLREIKLVDKLAETNDVEEQWEIFRSCVEKLRDDHIPKIVNNGKHKRGPVPLDGDTVGLIRLKHRKWEKYWKSRKDSDYREYCKVRNRVSNRTKRQQSNHEKRIADEAKTNPKLFHQYTNRRLKIKSKISNLKLPGTNQSTKSDEEKSQVLNDFFCSVFTNEPQGPLPQIKKPELNQPWTQIEITKEHVSKKLASLNGNKSVGPDEIHPKLLKELAEDLAEPLALIFSTSLSTQMIPEDWKMANITAIHKKGDTKIAGNYRPVSLTSVVVKVMESLVRDHIMDHMTRNQLFSNQQFGFMQKRSTTLQLLHVLEDWTKTIDEGGAVDCIYLDFAKAFDKVPHQRLISKVESFGITNPVLGWIQSFLANRKQRVVIQNARSQWKPVTSGVPQGSVLGPVLFAMYINDLPEEVGFDCLTYMFADDTKLYRMVETQYDQLKLQEGLDRFQIWASKWLMEANISKCKSLSIGEPTTTSSHTYHMTDADGEKRMLEVGVNEKDIGVVIDPKLNFELHIAEKVNKANRQMGIIRRSFRYLDQKMFVKLYKSLVRPHLEYANVVWCPYKDKDIKLVEGVQRRATKQVPGLKKLTYEQRLRNFAAKIANFSVQKTEGRHD